MRELKVAVFSPAKNQTINAASSNPGIWSAPRQLHAESAASRPILMTGLTFADGESG